MATVPLSGTNIRLLSGIPFSNDYKHTRWFATKTEQTAWFTSRNVVHSIDEANFQRIEGKHFIAVNKSIDDLWDVNYVMFRNASYNNKWFYGFVTQLEYKNRGTTHVHFQIDVLQTWRFEMNFKPSYVVREHRPLWNSDGTPVINTVDEGLNYGTDYDNVFQQSYSVNGDWKWLVIACKSPLETTGDALVEPSIVGYPQSLVYYCVPFHFANDQAIINIVGTDGNEYPTASIIDTYEALFTTDNAQNNIVSMYVTDHTGLNYSRSGGGTEETRFTFLNGNRQHVKLVNIAPNINIIRVSLAYEWNSKNIHVGTDKYQHFDEVEESKLLMYPYAFTVLDDFRGNRAIIKNEYIDGQALNITVKGSMGLSNKNAYVIEGYNNTWGLEQEQVADEHGVISNAPNDVPVLNDYLSAFLQGNRNSLENQKNSIMWNGFTNMMGSTIGAIAGIQQKNPTGVMSSVVGGITGAGNDVLQLQGMQAKLQDISNTPPQLQKMGSNNSYDFGNRMHGVFVMKKQIKPEYRKILSDFFKMYGYKTNEVKIPNFRTRLNWNYVETNACVITGNFNNEDIQELKNIFDNGITLWHTDDIGNYELSNEVR